MNKNLPTLSPAPMLGLIALWLLAPAGLHPLLLPDEGRYVGVAYAMLQGDALVPTLHGVPFFHKPPLMYWIELAAFHLFGLNDWSARLAPALGAWLMALALVLHLAPRVEPRRVVFALLVLATTPGFVLAGQYANLDMLVAGCITLTIVCALRALDAAAGEHRRWTIAAWGAAALGVLAKGLIGLVLPLLVLVPWLLAQRRWRDLQRLLHPAGIALFALVAVPWFVAMERRYPGFFDYFFVEQHFRRYTATGFNNPQPWWFFLAVVPLATLPWSAWWPAAWRAPAPSPRRGLYLWWAVAVVVFFSLPRSKLVGYVLPALMPLAALAATAAKPGRATRVAAALGALVCLGLTIALAWQAPESNRDIAQALRQRLQPGDRVVFVDAPFYDVPFYARLTAPPVVLSAWDDPSIPRRDNWRKELSDGRRFDAAAASRQLWPTARAQSLRCGAGSVWLLSTREITPFADAQLVLRGRHGLLLRAEGRAATACPP